MNFSKLSFIENDLKTDASDRGISAVVEHELNVQRKPIAFFSAKLFPAQSQYSTFFRELFVIYLAIKHFLHLLEGWLIKSFTDQKPIMTVINNSSNKYTACEMRDLNYIFLSLIYYRPFSLVSRVFANGPGDRGSIPRRVIPKTQKNGTGYLLA